MRYRLRHIRKEVFVINSRRTFGLKTIKLVNRTGMNARETYVYKMIVIPFNYSKV